MIENNISSVRDKPTIITLEISCHISNPLPKP